MPENGEELQLFPYRFLSLCFAAVILITSFGSFVHSYNRATSHDHKWTQTLDATWTQYVLRQTWIGRMQSLVMFFCCC